MIRNSWVVLGVVAFSMLTWETVAAPDVETILAAVLERDAEVNQRKQAYQFDLTLVNEKLNQDNSVIRKEVVQAIIRPGSGGAFQEIIGKANESPDEVSASDRKEISRSQGAMKSMDLKKLAPRFRIELEGEDQEQGIDCWVLSFKPKPGQPFSSREEKVINRLAGRFWVSKKDYSIVRSSGALTEPVAVAWVFAVMRELTFDYRTRALAGVGRVPETFDLMFDVQTPVNHVRRRQTSTMRNYRSL
ncbi:MAG: hypothetical protein OHK005_11300 [Candidatus Methylacidiphilales bacterium]